MPETIQRVGIFRPVTEECAAALAVVVDEACGEVRDYLADGGVTSPVKPRADFGLIIIRPEEMSRHLIASPEQRINFELFLQDVKRRVRPHEEDFVPIGLDRIIFPHGSRSHRVMLGLHSEARRLGRVRAEAELVTKIARSRFKGLDCFIEKFARLAMFGYGEPHNTQRLSVAHREEIASIFSRRLNRAGLRRAEFGRMVIGPSFREPLPGTEWL